jgi:hypothetical protein
MIETIFLIDEIAEEEDLTPHQIGVILLSIINNTLTKDN